MIKLIENDPLVMKAVSELQRFTYDPEMRELERRRKLWKLDYYSGLAAAKAEGKAEGKAEKAAESVIKALMRQQGAAPESLANRVRATTDVGKLDQLFELVFECKSLEEFKTRMLTIVS